MSYSVKVTVTSKGGATVYTPQVATGDDTPGNVAPAYGLADPLIIRQKLRSDSRAPLSHPEPDEAVITLIAPDGTTYAAMALGDPVGVQVYPQASFAGTPVEFYGRIAALNSEPHALGVKLSLSCIDYTADLTQLPAGGVANYPLEDAPTRIDRIWTELGFGTHLTRTPAGWTLTLEPILAARTKSLTDAYSLIVETMDSWAKNKFLDENMASLTTPPHGVCFRPSITQNITGGLLDPTTPYKARLGVPWTRRIKYAPPGRLTNLSGVYTLTFSAANSSPSTGAPIIDAGKVTFGPTFTQDKSAQLPNVTIGQDAQGNRYKWDWRSEIGYDTGGGTVGAGGLQPYNIQLDPQGPQILQEVDTIIDVTDAGSPQISPSEAVQVFRVPFRPDTSTAWLVGTMTWNAWSEASPWRRPELTELLVVARAQASHLPTNREWVVGLVCATTLTVAKGRPVIEIDTLPPSYDFELNRWALGSSLGVASFDSPIFGSITLSQLSPRDTFTDYQLLRGS